MTLTEVTTFTADIYVGSASVTSQHSYIGSEPLRYINDICQKYVDKVGLCVFVSEGKFIYTKGREHGYKITLINYPRFPSTPEAITEHAIDLAILVKEKYQQKRVSVVTSDKTIMLGDLDNENR